MEYPPNPESSSEQKPLLVSDVLQIYTTIQQRIENVIDFSIENENMYVLDQILRLLDESKHAISNWSNRGSNNNLLFNNHKKAGINKIDITENSYQLELELELKSIDGDTIKTNEEYEVDDVDLIKYFLSISCEIKSKDKKIALWLLFKDSKNHYFGRKYTINKDLLFIKLLNKRVTSKRLSHNIRDNDSLAYYISSNLINLHPTMVPNK